MGLPWWSSGKDSTLPLQGAWVQSLVGELRSRKPCGAAKNKQTNRQNQKCLLQIFHSALLSSIFLPCQRRSRLTCNDQILCIKLRATWRFHNLRGQKGQRYYSAQEPLATFALTLLVFLVASWFNFHSLSWGLLSFSEIINPHSLARDKHKAQLYPHFP